MNWLIFIAVAVLFDSLRIFVDNFTSDVFFKGRYAVSQKLFYGYAHIFVFAIVLAAIGFNFFSANPIAISLLFLSGICASVAGIPYFKALEIDDSTNIGIFTQLAPVMYLIFGWFLLGDTFSPIQLIAFAIVLAGPLLIVLTTKKRSRKIKIRAVLYAFLYVLISVIGNILFVKANESSIGFIEEVSIVYLGSGIADVLLTTFISKWHRRFRTVTKQSHKKVFIPLTINTCIGMVKQFSYRGALVTAPAVAIASVVGDSSEPIVIFFLGLLLTLIWPKFGRENLSKKTVLVHLIATVLVVVGIVLMQI